MVTRKIHQIWIQGIEDFQNQKPELYQYSLKFASLFPNYQYKLWGESDFLSLIENYSLNLLEAYQKAPNFACKADIARYVILFEEGGIYADTDYEPFKNCEFLLVDTDLVLVFMHFTYNKAVLSNFKFGNAWMYATPNNEFFHHLLTRIANNIYNPTTLSGYDYTWTITGPSAFSESIYALNLLTNPQVRIIPHSLIELADFSTTGLLVYNQDELQKMYPFAHGIHRMEGSWMDNTATIKSLFGYFYTWTNQWNDFINIGFILSIFILIIVLIFLVLFLYSCRSTCSFQNNKTNQKYNK